MLELAAVNAELTGQLQRESGHGGFWTDVDDTVTWRAIGAKSGTYHVAIDLACQNDSDGSESSITIGSQSIKGKVQGTGSWDKCGVFKLCQIRLEKADALAVTVKAIQKPRMAVMNLRSITLTPIDLAK